MASKWVRIEEKFTNDVDCFVNALAAIAIERIDRAVEEEPHGDAYRKVSDYGVCKGRNPHEHNQKC